MKRLLTFLLLLNIMAISTFSKGTIKSFMGKEQIEYFITPGKKPGILVISGIHGDEKSGIIFTERLKKHTSFKRSMLLIPKADPISSEKGNRTEYYMDDLNRSFFKNKDNKSVKIANEIIKIIKFYKPKIILDLHESKYNYNNDKDPKFYLGNSVICSEKTMENAEMAHIFLKIEEEGLTVLNSKIDGSLYTEIPKMLNIPVLTIETSQEENINKRLEKYDIILDIILSNLEFDSHE